MYQPLHDIACKSSPPCLGKDWSASARTCETPARSRHRHDWMNATHRKFVDGRPRIRSRSGNYFSQIIRGADRAPRSGVSLVGATLRGVSLPRPEAPAARPTGGSPLVLPLSEIVRGTAGREDPPLKIRVMVIARVMEPGDPHPSLSRLRASHLDYLRATEKPKKWASWLGKDFARSLANKIFARRKSPVQRKDTVDSPSERFFQDKMTSDHGL
jgi:hypothetical protein